MHNDMGAIFNGPCELQNKVLKVCLSHDLWQKLIQVVLWSGYDIPK